MTQDAAARARAQVEAEAREAARKYADINDACPYPFNSEAGRIFRDTFNAMRAALMAAPQVKP